MLLAAAWLSFTSLGLTPPSFLVGWLWLRRLGGEKSFRMKLESGGPDVAGFLWHGRGILTGLAWSRSRAGGSAELGWSVVGGVVVPRGLRGRCDTDSWDPRGDMAGIRRDFLLCVCEQV